MKHSCWNLRELFDHCNHNQAHIDNDWVPARPENSKKNLLSLKSRLVRAYRVFTGDYDVFQWPKGQQVLNGNLAVDTVAPIDFPCV